MKTTINFSPKGLLLTQGFTTTKFLCWTVIYIVRRALRLDRKIFPSMLRIKKMTKG